MSTNKQQVDVNNLLRGPFSHHVYVGFAESDAERVSPLIQELERRNVQVYPRYSSAQVTEASTKTNIHDGILCSMKCLIYLSPDYKDDGWYKIETQTILRKSSQFTRNMVIIVRDDRLKADDVEDIPEILREFSAFGLDKVDNIFQEIIKEPSQHLAVLPKENMGYSSAFGYFYGYLRLVLPGFVQRLTVETLAKEPAMLAKTVKKMLIVMPETCFCPPSIIEPGKIDHLPNMFVVRSAHRAGNMNRDYKSTFYKITDPTSDQKFYFVVELATPLLTMYETHYFGLSGMTKDQLYEERNSFYVILNSILNHPDNKECNNQCKLLFWNQSQTNALSLFDFLLPVVREEIAAEALKPITPAATPGSLEQDDPGLAKSGKPTDVPHGAVQEQEILETFVPIIAKGSHPGAIYDETMLSHYKMDGSLSGDGMRGFCVLVNIATFDKGNVQLSPRRGAKADTDHLADLFGNLKFRVEVHNDLTLDVLEKLLLMMHAVDHSRYDAFVFCMMTHGNLGVVYTSDGKAIRILDIVDFFTDKNCPSLKGKPKMFFIQACQRGVPEGSGSQMATDAIESDNISAEAAAAMKISTLEITDKGAGEALENVGQETVEEDARIVPLLLKSEPDQRSTMVPGSPDVLMSYSTLPGSISYRDTQAGSLYIQALDTHLRKNLEIDRALKLVTKEVQVMLRDRSANDGNRERFQLPFHLTSGMDKLLYL